MVQYNIIRNSIFTCNTTSGIGNKYLTAQQLYSLVDYDITTDDILLGESDVVCLDVDLGRRIKINSAALYTDDLTKANNIKFYYRNYEEDLEYLPCNQVVSSVAYIGYVPEPSAPRYIRCTISGVVLNLREFFVYNDTNVVNFGTDGTDTSKWLENTPIGGDSEPYTVDIYNNSSNKIVTAYVCVDYSGNTTDTYIKLSSTYDGNYVGITDGVLFGYDINDWNRGTYTSNTQLNTTRNSITLVDKGYSYYMHNYTLCTLPLNTCANQGVPFGLLGNCWCYDSSNNVIYAVFYNGTTSSNGTYILYKYTPSTNVWSFISNLILPGQTVAAEKFSMTYLNNYIYFTYGGDTTFGRYNLAGAQGNYEQLASVTCGGNNHLKLCAASDTIFKINKYWNGYGWYWYAYKYTISSNTWAAIAEPPRDYNTGNSRGSMCYDPVRNCLYVAIGDTGYNVSRYDIATDTWISIYINITSRFSTTFSNGQMSYYNDCLYFAGYSLGSKIHVINVVTNVLTTYDLNTIFKNQNFTYALATAPQYSDAPFSLYFLGLAYTDTYNFFGYNTPFTTINTEYKENVGVGTYTTNVFYLDSTYSSSFLLVDTLTEPGKTSVSTDASLQDGTIEIRSSNTPPANISEIYWGMNTKDSNTSVFLIKYDLTNSTLNTSFYNLGVTYITSVSVARYSANILVHGYLLSSGNAYYYYKIINRSGTVLFDSSSYATYGNYTVINEHSAWDNNNGIWFYHNNNIIRHYPLYTSTSYSSMTATSLYGFAAELNGTGLWYTDRSLQTVFRLNNACQVVLSFTLGNVYGICSTEDNGCWVVDNADVVYGYTVKRFDFFGNLVNTIVTEKALYYITHDHADGFYAREDTAIGNIYHFDSSGNITMKLGGFVDYGTFKAGRYGVVLHSETLNKIIYIDLATQSVLWEKTRSSITTNSTYTSTWCPGIFSWDLYFEKKYFYTSGIKLLPYSSDVYWNTLLEWKEVPKSGYLLPNLKYHQVRITLRNSDLVSTPEVLSITIAPVVVIEDIPTLSSKPVYVKSSIPLDNTDIQFNTKLRVWWSLGE